MPLLTGRNRDAERRAQDIMMTRIEQRYERQIAREIARAMNEASRKFDEPLWETTVQERHAENMLAILTRLWTQSGMVSAENLFTIAKAAYDMEQKRDITTPMVDQAISQWIRSFGAVKITQITDTTMAEITAIITSGIENGLGEREIGRQIQGVAPTKSASRSQTIARTEVHAATQGIGLEVAGSSEIPMMKVWLTADDDRVRTNPPDEFDHAEANGQTKPLGEPFDVGGELLEYPGDPSGSAANVINCRCTLGYEVA